MKKEYIKQIINFVLIFFAMILIFAILMFVSYALPNTRIKNNISKSKSLILNANANPFLGDSIKGEQMDNFTDTLILDIALGNELNENENILAKSMENSWYLNEEQGVAESLNEALSSENINSTVEYSRYWHGIQTIVRPLLQLFSYEDMKYIIAIFMYLLISVTIIKIYNNLGKYITFAFCIALLAICFFVVPFSLQYFPIFAVMLATILIAIKINNCKKSKMYKYLFFIVGGCTTFFDLLTTPILTLGIPLIIVILLEKEENTLHKLLYIIKNSLLWGISYTLTFFSKWIIASVVLKRNVIIIAINQILFRTNGSQEYPVTRLGAISENIKILNNRVMLVIFGVIFIAWIVMFIKSRKNIKAMKNIVSLILVSTLPYIWYFIFAGHSSIHAFFTYRLQAISIFGILCAMIESIDFSKVIKKNKLYSEGENKNE